MIRKNKMPGLDIAKFVMSIMVVAIHTHLFPELLFPWLRMAVPIFFLISSYLFYTKMQRCENDSQQARQVLKRFVSRNIHLYCFWLTATLPVVIADRLEWFEGGIVKGILISLRNILFASTFTGSWFITASIIAAVVIYFLSNKLKISDRVLLIFAAVLYALLSLRSSYMFLVPDSGWIDTLIRCYEAVFTPGICSFPVAVCYFIFGRELAKKPTQRGIGQWAGMALVSCCLLWAEWRLVYRITGNMQNDIYFMLPMVAVCAFRILSQLPIKTQNTDALRKSSTVIYASHGAVIRCVKLAAIVLGTACTPPVLFCATVAGCFILCAAILCLSRSERFKFLRYSY